MSFQVFLFSFLSCSSSGKIVLEIPAGSGTEEINENHEPSSQSEPSYQPTEDTAYEDATGLTGAIGGFYFVTLTGGYWASEYYLAGAFFTFIVPQDVEIWELYVPTMDSCQTSDRMLSDVENIDVGYGSISFENNNSLINLPWNPSSSIFTTDTLTKAQLPDNSYLSLSPSTNPYGYEVSDIARTSKAPTIIEPSISADLVPFITKDQVFQWQPVDAPA